MSKKLKIFLITSFFGLILLVLLSVDITSKGNRTLPFGPLTVGTNNRPGYEPFYLAKSLGYYDRAQIHLAEFTSSTQVIMAFRNGEIHAACLTMGEVLSLLEHKVNVKIILVLDISDGADVVLSKPEFKTMKDLKGRRIGVENSALGAYMLTRALEKSGMNKKDITLIPLTLEYHFRSFQENHIDAIVTFEPVRTELLKSGARDVFNSSQIPGEIIDLLVVNSDIIEEREEQLLLLLKSWFGALNYLDKYPQESAGIISRHRHVEQSVLNSYKGLKPGTLEENLVILQGDPPPLMKRATYLADVMMKNGLLKNKEINQDIVEEKILVMLERK